MRIFGFAKAVTKFGGLVATTRGRELQFETPFRAYQVSQSRPDQLQDCAAKR
jgi:hypothetical protein